MEFVHLDGSAEVIRERMSSRAGHYMPASLLDSQIATLEPLQADESGLVLDVSLPPDELVSAAVSRLGLPSCRVALRDR
jgi:gluconokinase